MCVCVCVCVLVGVCVCARGVELIWCSARVCVCVCSQALRMGGAPVCVVCGAWRLCVCLNLYICVCVICVLCVKVCVPRCASTRRALRRSSTPLCVVGVLCGVRGVCACVRVYV